MWQVSDDISFVVIKSLSTVDVALNSTYLLACNCGQLFTAKENGEYVELECFSVAPKCVSVRSRAGNDFV